MAERKWTHGLTIREDRETIVVSIGQTGVWDREDLSLLRDTLKQLICRKRLRAVGIDLQSVRFLPSGFFGTLHEWFDRGIAIRLYSPEPLVRNLVWFQRFLVAERDGCFRFRDPITPPVWDAHQQTKTCLTMA
jgi:hypothetical protein